ncbi:MAG: TolC family protein [Bacteroidales bacterium]|nr:TolC family protein [Candidatus Physcousia equi]
MKTNYIFSLALGLLSLLLCPAMHAQQLTLEACREAALQHNVKIQKQLLEVENAELQRKEAFTKFFPSVSGLGGFVQFDKPQVEMDMSALVGAPVLLEMLKNGVVGAINAQMPIFVGGQIVNGNRLAKVGYQIKQLQMLQTQNEVCLTAEQYYWQVVSLQQKLITLQAQQQQLEAIVQDAQNAVEAGLSNRNDLLQAQLYQNKVASGIISLQGYLDVSKLVLAQYCGFWSPDDSLFDASSLLIDQQIMSDAAVQHPGELLVDHAAALPNTPEYALAQEGVRATQLQYKMEVGSHLPTVAVGGSYSYTNLMRNNFGFGDNHKRTALAFATVSVPITDWWGGSYAMRRKKNAVRSAEYDRQEASQLLIVRMQSAFTSLCTAHQQIGIARKSIEQANENLRLEKDYYEAGTSTMSNLLKAQSSVQEAQDAFTDAWIDYQQKRLEYLQATGR